MCLPHDEGTAKPHYVSGHENFCNFIINGIVKAFETDDRLQALAAARELSRIADQFEQNEPARRVLRRAALKLKQIYVFTRPQKKKLILDSIADGYQRFDELVDKLGFSDWEMRSLIDELKTDGYIDEKRVGPAGGGPGRPYRMYSIGRILVSEQIIHDQVF